MRNSHIWLIVATILLTAISVIGTVALLVSSSNTVVNTFTVGGVTISLTESTGNEYKMTPGATVNKDPTVTVHANSESCWLFVKVEKENDFDTFCTYEIQDGWIALDGHEGVFYQEVERTSSDKVFRALKDNKILIKENLTEEQLNAVNQNPTLKFTAYAAQSDGLAVAEEAWQALNQ